MQSTDQAPDQGSPSARDMAGGPFVDPHTAAGDVPGLLLLIAEQQRQSLQMQAEALAILREMFSMGRAAVAAAPLARAAGRLGALIGGR